MKKLLITASILVLTALPANAKSYFGVEAQRNSMSVTTKSMELSNTTFTPDASDYYGKDAYSPAVFAGTQVLDNLDIELNYSHSKFDKTNTNTGLIIISTSSPLNTKSTIKLDNIALDFKPKIVQDKITFYGILGLSYVRANASENYYGNGLSSITKQTENGVGYSIGAGAEYMITKEFGTRFQAKYTKTNLDFDKLDGLKSIDNVTSLALGVLYKF